MTPDAERRIRVLVLATRVPESSGDGTPSFVLDQSIAMSSEFEVLLLAPCMTGAASRSRHGPVEVRRFRYLPKRFETLADRAILPQLALRPHLWLKAVMLSLAMGAAALRLHRSWRPSVVHAHWIVPAGAVAWLLRRLYGTPFVLTSHGGDAGVLSNGALRLVARLIVRRSHTFVAVSQEIRRQFAAVSARTFVRPVGVDVRLWQEEARGTRGSHLLFVGRLVEKKGVEMLVRALASTPDVSLRIVGDGPIRPRIEALIMELGLGGRIETCGEMPRRSVRRELHRCSAVVIPSAPGPAGDRDGTPAVLGEAIAAGAPVIASRIAGLGEFIVDGETGLLFDPDDATGLRVSIERHYSDIAAAHARAEAAKDGLLPFLSLDATTEAHAMWYREAADGG